MATNLTGPAAEPAAAELPESTGPDALGLYACEVDNWRGDHRTYRCSVCRHPVLAGLVCRRLACLDARMSSRYVGCEWRVEVAA